MKWNSREKEEYYRMLESRNWGNEVSSLKRKEVNWSMVLILIFGFNLFISLKWIFNLAFRPSKITFTGVVLFLFSNQLVLSSSYRG